MFVLEHTPFLCYFEVLNELLIQMLLNETIASMPLELLYVVIWKMGMDTFVPSFFILFLV